jgi:putative ABC transport system substrate-binding protein
MEQILPQAQSLGWRIDLLTADERPDLERLLVSRALQAADAWYVPTSFISYRFAPSIIRAQQRLSKPAIHTTVQEVRAGALMAYAQDTSFAQEAMADLVARIYAGEDPAQIPIDRPRRFTLAVRPRAEPASTRLPLTLVQRADLII